VEPELGVGAGLIVDLGVKYKKAVVNNLTFRPEGVLPGVTDDLPGMAYQQWTFSRGNLRPAAEVRIQASEVGLDNWGGFSGLGSTAEKLFLLDLITVAEGGLSGESPPGPARNP
jgi:hypothetical protein